MDDASAHWPTELRVKDMGRLLRVTFEDGAAFEFAAELLRVKSPSAETQGHSPAERKILGGKRQVAILAAEAIGNYAVKLTFSDGHDTGLFTWAFLHELGRTMEQAWQAYFDDLASRGLSRG